MTDQDIVIEAQEATLSGVLHLPQEARGLVVFAHGSGSSRRSPRNRQVARALQKRGLGTLLFDLLTASEEEEDRETLAFRFNIELLRQRLCDTTDFLLEYPETSALIQGYFGSSTGAAAALMAAAERPHAIGAVVSRGGRPDLAGSFLPEVRCPTLFLVGGRDFQVLDLHREALPKMQALVELSIVPHATHLFEEPGALEEVCRLAGDWFTEYLQEVPLEVPFA